MRFTVLGILLFSLKIYAQPCLNTSINRGLQYSPLETIASDFNLDGNSDIAIITDYSGNPGIIQILLGNGNNTFGTALNVAAGQSPSSLTSGDFNSDGIPDLAVANYGTNYVSVLLGLGTGSFAATVNYTLTSNSVYALNCNDYNGDGNLDMAVTSQTTVSIFSGLGTGLFSAPISYSSVSANLIKSADLNNDGKLDLILANKAFSSPYLYVAMGLSTGGYANAVATNVCNSPGAIICDDFNDDGITDVVVTNSSCSYRSVLIGTGTGSFSNVFLNYCLEGQTAAISADFNNDGKQDIAVTSSGNASVDVLLGTGILNAYYIFESSDYVTGTDPQSVACSDFNGDGHLDLVVGNRNAKTLSVLNGSGNGKFAAAGLTNVNENPSFTTSADLNNDGNSDLVIGYSNSNSGTVLLSDGSGTSWSWYSANLGTTPLNAKCADINHDGNMDLVAVNGYTNTLTIRPGLGNGTFTSSIIYTLTSSPNNIATGDFNNDGNTDFAVTQTTGNISIILGTTTGTLLPAINYSVSGLRTGIVVNDYNNDGKLDLVTTSYNSNSYYVSLGIGNGNFATEVTYNAPGAYPLQTAGIASKDFNSDGIPDLAITQTNISTNAGNLAVLIATGTGSFTNSGLYSTGSFPNSIASADYNGDGKTDLAIVSTDYNNGSSTYNNVSLFLGSGSGTFGAAINYPVGIDPVVVENADFNNDAKTDLVSLNYRSSNITVIMNGLPVELTSANSICEGSSINILAYGANTYSWSTGSSANNINVSPTVNATYTVTGIATSGCIGIAVKTISVTAAPSISVTSGTICSGSSFTITPGGAHTYTFSTGGNIVSPLSSASYTVLGTNTITTCTGTAISTIYVDQNCQDVWPGDANSDGIANNLDVLELGLHYTQTGSPRSLTSNSWQSYFANNWIGTITNGKNLNHSDCNGDGIINDDDTLAIFTNYGLTHAFKTAQTNTVNPQLSIIPDQTSVVKGAWGTASIYLGNVSNPITSINGVAFTVNFNTALIEPNNIYIEYQNSFLDISQNLYFRKLNFVNGELYTATTHTISNDVAGYGKIATLHYQIKSNLTSDQVLNIGLTQTNQSYASGIITPLTSGTATLMAVTNSVDIKEILGGNIISISPNPTNGLLTVTSKTELQKIEVMTLTGQILISEICRGNNHLLHLDNFANGIYFVNLFQNNHIIKREKVIVNK